MHAISEGKRGMIEPGTRTSLDVLPRARLRRSDVPIYRQIFHIFRDAIVDGRLPVGSPLPKEADLVERFGVSLVTVRQALQQLELEGLIQKRAAKTAIVIADTPRARPSWVLNNFADLIANTRKAKLDIASWSPRRSAIAAATFRLPEAEPCPCLRARLIVGGVATTQVTIYFPPSIGNRLRLEDFDDVVVFRSVQRRLGVQYGGARVTLRADVADAALSRALDYGIGEPVLVNEITFLSPEGAPVELTILKHRADFYNVTYDLKSEAG